MKVFEPQTSQWEQVRALDDVDYLCEVIEDNVMVQYKSRQMAGLLKGVSDNYPAMIGADSIVLNGAFELQDPVVSYVNMGVSLAGSLGTNAHFIDPITLYAPTRQGTINMANPMASIHSESLFMASIISINQLEFDSRYMIAPIAVARSLFDYPTQVSHIEIKARRGASVDNLKQQISQILGPDYQVSNRKEQQADFLKVTNIEKWVTFLILIFILLIATFNVISTLSMVIVDKQDDIQTLYALGADHLFIRQLFLLEGWMISLLGTVIGIIIGTLLCLVQQHFGILTLGSDASFIVDSYPVRVDIVDIIITFTTVAIIGFIATLYPVYSIKGHHRSESK